MAYQSCSKCGSINRADATHCYQCEASLDAPPPPPPPSAPPPPSVAEPSAFGGEDVPVRKIGEYGQRVKPRDLEARYEKKALPQVDSSFVHGLRCGPLAGLVLGAVMGLYRNYFTDETARMLMKKFTIEAHGLPMAGYSVGLDMVFGTLLACLLGMVNMLCFPPESARAGAVIGALAAALLVYTDQRAEYFNVVVGLVHGFALAWLCSQIERKLYRGLD